MKLSSDTTDMAGHYEPEWKKTKKRWLVEQIQRTVSVVDRRGARVALGVWRVACHLDVT
jgi:hypothetical protein